jgi:hypothetical protein
MSFKVRSITEADLPIVSSWFSNVAWSTPPVEASFPEHGFVVESNGSPVACCWLYLNNTRRANPDWIAVDPKAAEESQCEAIMALMRYLDEAALHVQPSIELFVTHTKNRWLAEVMKRCGYRASDGWIRLTRIVDGHGSEA